MGALWWCARWPRVGVALLTLVLAMLLPGCGGGGGTADNPPPTITTQPGAVSVDDGKPATFSVAAGGSGLSYQWQRNGTAIPGATLPTYTTPPLTLTDNGTVYTVVVSNAGGNVSSQPVKLTVTPVAPHIDSPPSSIAVDDGAEAAFGVHATGSQPVTYQWYLGGVEIAGATDSSLVLPAARLSDSGAIYSVKVSNVAGSETSSAASLSVRAIPPHVDNQPQAASVLDGEVATFLVAAHGSGTLSYQWLVNGQPVAGATAPLYERTATYADNAATVSVVISSEYGTVTTPGVVLTVNPRAPTFSREPQSVSLATGGTASFTVSAQGTEPMAYQWQRSDDGGASWNDVPGATATTLSVPDVTLSWNGAKLRVRVTNPAAAVMSEVVQIRALATPHIIAGTAGGTGYADGVGEQARFGAPSGVAIDSDGSVLVADWFNQVVRRVTPSGIATTVFGYRGSGGGDGAPGAGGFIAPQAIARTPDGHLYVGDTTRIRAVSPDGTVSTLAGSGEYAVRDGTGANAAFAHIVAMASDAQGNLWVVEGNPYNVVRKVTPAGTVSTVAGSPSQSGYVNGPGATARFNDLRTIALSPSGDAYVADTEMIRKVSADGTVSLFAGSPGWTNGLVNDGPRLSATFWQITALAFDAGGNLWVGHSQTIRMIDTTGNVSTIAGGTNCPDDGDRDGRGASACLIDPTSITALPDGSGMVFSEAIGSTIRFIDASGNVRTWAGSSPHSASIDGVGSAARFASTSPIAIAPDGSLWVGSPFKLRHVLPNGQVTSEDLDTAVLLNIGGMAFDSAGNLYLTDVQMHRVVKRSTSGTYSIVAGVGGVAGHDDGPAPKATFNGPQGIAVAKDGTLYVADRQNGTIRHIAQDGSVSTVAGAPGSSCQSVDGMLGTNRLCSPYDLTFDSQGRLLISDIGAAVIRRLETDGRLITFAGTPSVAGYGEGPAARFRSPGAIAVDAADNIYVADGANSLIRRVTPDGITSTVIGHLGTLVLQNALDGAINQPTGLVVLANGHLVFGTEGAIVGD